MERELSIGDLSQELKDQLTCGICYSFVTESKSPLECNNCHNALFCTKCLENWLEQDESAACPYCNDCTVFVDANQTIMSIIKNLSFKCQNHDRGCLKELPQKELSSHEACCDFKAVKSSGIIGLWSCQICKITVSGTESEKENHLCYARKNQYANSMCHQHCLMQYLMPFNMVQEGRQMKIAQMLKCSICEELLCKPKTCDSCKVNFCTRCISQKLFL